MRPKKKWSRGRGTDDLCRVNSLIGIVGSLTAKEHILNLDYSFRRQFVATLTVLLIVSSVPLLKGVYV